MKNLLTATLPALALLALGGCATSGALTSTTESDGVYYSSQDKTTATSKLNSVYTNRGYNQSVANSANPDGFAYNRATDATGTDAAPATTDDANPDYVAGAGTATEGYDTSTLGASSDYYANSLAANGSGFGVPYTGPGMSSYNYSSAVSNYSPFYGSPYGAGLGYGAFGGYGYPYGGLYSPYAYSGFYDPFYSPGYSPFYSPFGYGSGLSLAFGFGYGGFGGFGYPYRGYGYGRGFYGNDYYGGGFYNRPAIYTNRTNAPTPGAVLVGGRPSRGGAVLGNAVAPGNPALIAPGRGTNIVSSGAPASTNPGNGSYNGPVGSNGRAVTFGGGQPTAAPGVNPGAAQPQAGTPARRGFFGGFFGNSGNGGSVSGGQPVNAGGTYGGGSYGGGRQRERSSFGQVPQQGGFSQPQRSFSQPQPQRSFSQPQPTFSQPQPARSFGGGGGSFGGGGGSFGGGGGGGGRGRR